MLRQNRILIDLDAICHNYRLLAANVPASVRVMPVIKANAYGHGMVEVAHAVTAQGANWLAVALAEEGIALRESGVTCDILVLGAAMEAAAEECIAHGLTQTVFEPHMVHCLNDTAARMGKTALVHLKLDTGMNRIGLSTEQEADELRAALDAAPHVQATGVYTHFADADNPPKAGGLNDFTRRQLARFAELKSRFDPSLCAHAANSATGLLAPEACFQMVRDGIVLYGYPPVKTTLPFRRALRWEAEVVHLKTIAAGDTVGYGRSFTAAGEMRIATVAVGYGDGFHRALSNRGQMLVSGCRAPIVGRVCMDQTMIDVTGIPDVTIGSQVVLLGTQGAEEIDAEELALWADTISYEVLLAPTARVPRVYGKPQKQPE